MKWQRPVFVNLGFVISPVGRCEFVCSPIGWFICSFGARVLHCESVSSPFTWFSVHGFGVVSFHGMQFLGSCGARWCGRVLVVIEVALGVLVFGGRGRRGSRLLSFCKPCRYLT